MALLSTARGWAAPSACGSRIGPASTCRARSDLGLGRIVVTRIAAPIVFVDLV
jgi:hypothetical protein